MPDEHSGVDKVADVIKDIKTCMLTTTGADGLLSRPMVVQQVRFDGDLWFVTDGGSTKVAQIRHGDGRVNAAFATGDTWLSLTGTAEVTHDDGKAQELWNANLDTWFPQGPSTPGLTLIKVHADSAEYWDLDVSGPVGAVSGVIKLATARIKGQRPDIAENETVELGSGATDGAR